MPIQSWLPPYSVISIVEAVSELILFCNTEKLTIFSALIFFNANNKEI